MASSLFTNTRDITNPAAYPPSRTALLLLDYHNLFFTKFIGPESKAALQKAVDLRSWAQKHGIAILHCLIDVNAEPFPTCKGYDNLAGTVSALRSSGGEEAPELSASPSEGGMEKTFTRRPGHVSAFKSPGLEDFLREKGITSLLLAGISTSGCVNRTALVAADAEFVVTVIEDACADPKEGVHDFMVKNVLNNRSYVCKAAEFQEGYAKVYG